MEELTSVEPIRAYDRTTYERVVADLDTERRRRVAAVEEARDRLESARDSSHRAHTSRDIDHVIRAVLADAEWEAREILAAAERRAEAIRALVTRVTP